MKLLKQKKFNKHKSEKIIHFNVLLTSIGIKLFKLYFIFINTNKKERSGSMIVLTEKTR